MKGRSPEVDAYIEQAPEFARPILNKLRALFHQACPDIEETMKWRTPHFDYRGVLGCIAAFKKHVGFGFWKASLMKDPHRLFTPMGTTSMGSVKITSVDELPSDAILLEYIREAVALNVAGVKMPAAKKRPKKKLELPAYFLAALRKNKKALAAFEAFPPSHQREYVEWITEAKQEETRNRRLATALAWMAQGKSKNWKYEK